MPPTLPAETIAHSIQIALTPVFLLSGIAVLLNVFSTRLGRVADRVDLVTAQIRNASEEDMAFLTRQLDRLRRRAILLDAAVVLAGIGAALTCLTALLLFASQHEPIVAKLIVGTFGLALCFAISALSLFLSETLLSGRAIRATVDRQDAAQAAAERDFAR
ncbi:DUF2721 domain-containing protein [Enterovirga rhinocerotis]|uniref:Uncharacterized protein DUF2721 n=1 Tax=Enterovirga rhinocerotis TaxID=1339210 RepID=A0A4R7BPH8_9HYPH|nr:DUF2721 domain-containing protein [Enterovirga rhinocerotis]TDR87271.1 uncharacterized protein DUF2721 [Enterovirga rhinocerotis]